MVKICVFTIDNFKIIVYHTFYGGIAQLARAPALQAGGHEFESHYLHVALIGRFFYSIKTRSR